MTEAVTMNEDGLRTVLLAIYDAKPSFPIKSEMDLIAALGGPLNVIPVNDSDKLPASILAEKAMAKCQEFNTPEEIVDSIMGESFINVVTKTKIYTELFKLSLPIKDPDSLARANKYIKSSGIDPECFLKRLDFPVQDMDKMFASLRECESEVFSDTVPVLCKIPKKMMEAAVEMAEADAKGEAPKEEAEGKEVEFHFGLSYLIEADRPDKCFEYFSVMVNDMGVRGLAITRTNPKMIREKHLLPEADIFWLTDRDSLKERTIGPSLETLAYEIENLFIAGGNSVVLLDGAEYLISSNSFQAFLKFIRQMVDTASENSAVMLMPISPETLDTQELKTLERELETLSPNDFLVLQVKGGEEEESFGDIEDLEDLSELDEGPKAEKLKSISERMDRIKQIAQSLKASADDDAASSGFDYRDQLDDAKEAPQLSPGEKPAEPASSPPEGENELEDRVNMGNQIKDWLEEGYQVEHLKFMLEADIETLRGEFNETMAKMVKLKELHEKLKEGLGDEAMAKEMIGTIMDPGDLENAEKKVEQLLSAKQ